MSFTESIRFSTSSSPEYAFPYPEEPRTLGSKTAYPLFSRYCVTEAKEGRRCDSGPPWMSTTTGYPDSGGSVSGTEKNAGISRPSKVG
jgi:hypothetical protein